MAFAGKVVLITGGAGGIGLALVKEFLKNNAKGVAILDISEAGGREALAQIEGFGPDRAIFIKTDITDEKQFEDAFKKTVETYKQLDIVINNAGILDEVHGWDKTLQVNLVGTMRGSYLAMQKYLPKYKSGPEGIIANTASVAGLSIMASIPAYTVSKNGIVVLGRTLGSKDFYDTYKVRIVTVCPGAIDTQLLSSADDQVLFLESFKKDQEGFLDSVQSPQRLAENYLKIIEQGKTGSVWVTEDNGPPYEVVPETTNLRSLSKHH